MEHTALPWRWENAALLGLEHKGYSFNDCVLRCLGNCTAELDDETLIVRAVNNHYQLLEALELWVEHAKRWHREGQAGEGRRCTACIEHETQARAVIEEAKK